MRLVRAHIVNFRCLRDLSVSFDDVTVLVGTNSTGKSTVLHALDWFFRGGGLELEDIHGHQEDERVTVGLTFADFDYADREALGSYVLGDEATFWRSWSLADGEKLTGKGRAYPAFATVREKDRAMEKRATYNALRDAQPELGLPYVTSAGAVDAALAAWEAEHPDQLEDGRTDATHLFGVTGQARLARRMDFVLIPAVADPDAETRDARGTLLRQLLDRALGEQSQMRERLDALESRVSQEIGAIMRDEGGPALDGLSGAVTAQLSQLVPGGEVLLTARAPNLRMPSLSVDVRVADEGLDTTVGRQGHGFQRALLIAVVQEIAALSSSSPAPDGDDQSDDAPTPAALVLGIEEPELYQHPLQARHFAATLSELGAQAGAPVQVAYATHSEHFVDPAHYERLRRFRRRSGASLPESQIKEATVEAVVRRLQDVVVPEQIPLRVRMTLRRQLAEAVFAKSVVLLEGESDVGLLQGLADRSEGLDALGVAPVPCHGKGHLLIPWAILTELGIPTYAVFDGDAGLGPRMRAAGKHEADVQASELASKRANALILRTLGLPEEEQPETYVGQRHAVFADRLETELGAWDGFDECVRRYKVEQGDFRDKPDDAYRYAAASVPSEPPTVLRELFERVTRMAR